MPATRPRWRTATASDYVITGRKMFITNGREATFALVFAQTDVAAARKGITAFVVEKGTPGFTVSKTEDKLGIRASDTAELVFDECRVPAAHRIGEEGQGFKIALATLDGGRIGIAAQAVGIAAGAYDALGGLRARAQGVRRADRPAPDGAVDAGRHGDDDRRRAAAHPQGGRPEGRRAPLHAGRGHGQAVRGRDRDEGDHRRGAGARRLRLHPRVPRSSATSATPRSRRSTRAPRRSRSW